MRPAGMRMRTRRSTTMTTHMQRRHRSRTCMGPIAITATITITSTDRPMPRARRTGRQTVRQTGLQSTAPASAHALLQLMWLASPALPVGGFSYSEVLEAAVEAGEVQGEAQAGAWLRDQLQLSLARSDLAVVAKAFKAWARADLAHITELNGWVTTPAKPPSCASRPSRWAARWSSG